MLGRWWLVRRSLNIVMLLCGSCLCYPLAFESLSAFLRHTGFVSHLAHTRALVNSNDVVLEATKDESNWHGVIFAALLQVGSHVGGTTKAGQRRPATPSDAQRRDARRALRTLCTLSLGRLLQPWPAVWWVWISSRSLWRKFRAEYAEGTQGGRTDFIRFPRET